MTTALDLHLNRLLHWRWLVIQMAKLPEYRDASLKNFGLEDAELYMSTVVHGSVSDEGHFCVSACCAIGSAALYPPFQGQGLNVVKIRYLLSPNEVSLDGEPVDYDSAGLADFFGLDQSDYSLIVNPALYGPKDRDANNNIIAGNVIARIEAAILRNHGRAALDLEPQPF